MLPTKPVDIATFIIIIISIILSLINLCRQCVLQHYHSPSYLRTKMQGRWVGCRGPCRSCWSSRLPRWRCWSTSPGCWWWWPAVSTGTHWRRSRGQTWPGPATSSCKQCRLHQQPPDNQDMWGHWQINHNFSTFDPCFSFDSSLVISSASRVFWTSAASGWRFPFIVWFTPLILVCQEMTPAADF